VRAVNHRVEKLNDKMNDHEEAMEELVSLGNDELKSLFQQEIKPIMHQVDS